jgi:hypothetical protein
MGSGGTGPLEPTRYDLRMRHRYGLAFVLALLALLLSACGGDGGAWMPPPPALQLLAGNAGGWWGNADGTGTEASFHYPKAVATDSAGNVYVADNGNKTIRKITPSGVVTTIVGKAGNVFGSQFGNLPGLLADPRGLALSGNTLYITTANAVVQVTNVP